MKIDGKTPAQGPEGSRFQAAKSITAKEGGKSFGALLKKATEAKPAPASGAPAPAPASATPAAPATGSAAAAPSAPAEAKVPRDDAPAQEAKSEAADFASHMDMVKMRLKSGYYNNTNVNDALSEKLTGFFDDLA